MTDVTDLIATTLPSSVRVHGGTMPRLTVENAYGKAEVYFQGAHVTAWHPAVARDPVLWMSRASLFEPGRPLRGGVPICFPWFGPNAADSSAPAHGFARVCEWKLVEALEDASGNVTLALELAGEGLSPHWPHRFRARHRITVGAVLRLELKVQNDDAEAFTFEEALHSYFGVRDIHHVTITGLENTDYMDKVGGLTRRREDREPLRFSGETDRVYLDSRGACVVHDPDAPRRISVGKAGSDATVVWNPWIAKARAMPDFGDDEWPGMVCVETGNVGASARRLAAGGSHTMTATIEVQDLT
jgi:glucose-6-phosphate 1-epimerase